MAGKLKTGADHIFILLISMLLVVGTASAAAGQAREERRVVPDPGSGKVYAEQIVDPRWIEVKPLDDPANPYLAQYEEWDNWIHSHAVIKYTEMVDKHRYPDFLILIAWVDQAGYLLPQTVAATVEERAMNEGEYNNVRCQYFELVAEGEMDPSLKERMDQALIEVKAAYYPPIPAWLGEHPPHNWAQLRPDGEVLTYGELGSLDLSNIDLRDDLPYCRYSVTGELLGRVESTFSPLHLFYDEAAYGPLPKGEIVPQAGAGWLIKDPVSGATLGYYAYDGTPLPDGDTLPENGHYRVIHIPGKDVPLYYQAQQAGQ